MSGAQRAVGGRAACPGSGSLLALAAEAERSSCSAVRAGAWEWPRCLGRFSVTHFLGPQNLRQQLRVCPHSVLKLPPPLHRA